VRICGSPWVLVFFNCLLDLGRTIDNLALSDDGSIVVASFPKALDVYKSAKDISVTSPVSVHRISINTGHDSYFGEKYKVEKVCFYNHRLLRTSSSQCLFLCIDKIFEEDGSFLGSAATIAAMHQDNLYMHGTLSFMSW
jgi:hypothetical protein